MLPASRVWSVSCKKTRALAHCEEKKRHRPVLWSPWTRFAAGPNERRTEEASGRQEGSLREYLISDAVFCTLAAFPPCRTRLVRAGGRRQASLSRSSFRFAVLRRGVVREDKHRRAASATDIRAPLPPAARRSRSLRLLRASPPAAARPLPPRAVRCV